MKNEFVVTAEPREDKGKGASRRLRRTGKVPAILYGGDKEPLSIALKHNELLWNLDHETFYSQVLKLEMGGKTQKIILRDLQRHPSQPRILHVDFQRVLADEKLKVHVPLHFINEDDSVGVKQQGGMVSHLLTDVEVECLPGDIPGSIDIDVAELEIGDSVRLSDLKLSENVTLVELALGEDHNSVVLTISPPQAEEPEVDAEEISATGEEAPAEGEELGGEDKE
ncbi:MAG: 50S ribosomal protein L25/general stress protein Ctc [Gammaproteobacteria bacterium]|nr:50S ribosomal protein L25/general stress protein Ctc [Gammaproteobacteria bacterium]